MPRIPLTFWLLFTWFVGVLAQISFLLHTLAIHELVGTFDWFLDDFGMFWYAHGRCKFAMMISRCFAGTWGELRCFGSRSWCAWEVRSLRQARKTHQKKSEAPCARMGLAMRPHAGHSEGQKQPLKTHAPAWSTPCARMKLRSGPNRVNLEPNWGAYV